jgi:hypothetical protein
MPAERYNHDATYKRLLNQVRPWSLRCRLEADPRGRVPATRVDPSPAWQDTPLEHHLAPPGLLTPCLFLGCFGSFGGWFALRPENLASRGGTPTLEMLASVLSSFESGVSRGGTPILEVTRMSSRPGPMSHPCWQHCLLPHAGIICMYVSLKSLGCPRGLLLPRRQLQDPPPPWRGDERSWLHSGLSGSDACTSIPGSDPP